LNALETLSLAAALKDKSSLTNAALQHLAELKALKTLYIRGHPDVTNEGVKAFRAAVPKCEVDWNDEPNRKLAEWVISKGGNVSVNTQKDPVREVAKLPPVLFRVVKVSLAGTGHQLTDDDLKYFEDVDGITTVYNTETKLTDTGLERWSRFP